jgi:M6 family metalloprotease-like protein
MAVLIHEFGHDYLNWKDLHDKARGRRWVGHFSLMGDPRPLCSLTPPHPDPMHKLLAGWLEDSIVYGVIGDIDLPIIEA